jgi:hypothetical protein
MMKGTFAVAMTLFAASACERPKAQARDGSDVSAEAASSSSAASGSAADAHPRSIRLADGDEIFAIEPIAVKQIEYATPTRTVVALRPARRETRFKIVEKDPSGNELRSCSSSEPFDRAFGAIESIHVRRVVPPDRWTTLRRADVAELRIVSTIQGEPAQWKVVPFDEGGTQLALVVDDAGYALDLPSALVTRLTTGCGSK